MNENEKNDYLKKVIDYFGTQNELADKLKVHKQTVSSWYAGRLKIPVIYALKIEYLTKGKFKHIKLLDEETRCYLKNT